MWYYMSNAKIITYLLVIILIQTITASPLLARFVTNSETEWDIIVDDGGTGDYTKIQDAIDAASDEDAIFVKNGAYYENLVIDKSIKLIGENKCKTTIDGGIKETLFKSHSIVIQVDTDNVEISGFTIQNATGINGRGVYFLKNKGISPSENNIITNNIIKNCSYGLMVANPKNNIVTNNSFYNCAGGFYITKLPYYENIFENNTVNDNPIIYHVGEENFEIEGEAGVISLLDCKNVTIANVSTSHITVGIDISFSYNITVTNCTITNTNRGGIYVQYSNNCKFVKNTFENDNWGIFLRESNNNLILKNNFLNITKCDWFGSSFKNTWDGNFWEKSLNYPKLIYGKIGFKEKMPWFNIDWNPSTKLN